MTLTLRDLLYFRRLGAIFAGLDHQYLTYLEEETVRSIKDEVSNLITLNFETSGDEQWADFLADSLAQKLSDDIIDVSTVVGVLEEEYKRRLNVRRQTSFACVYAFYDFTYLVSVLYMVLGRVSADVNYVDTTVQRLKYRMLPTMDKYLGQIAQKLSGNIL